MKRVPYQPQSDYYDERIASIDEKICELLKQRKEISNNHPGFPYNAYISNWAKKFDLYEDFLNSLFGALRMEEHFRPKVEPNGFLKHLPVLKSVEKDKYVYTVTFIRQYTNASVVKFNIDWDGTKDLPMSRREHKFIELFIGKEYDCYMDRGNGSTGQYTYSFVVSPALPDDISGLNFTFKEYSTPFYENPTGHEIIIHVD